MIALPGNAELGTFFLNLLLFLACLQSLLPFFPRLKQSECLTRSAALGACLGAVLAMTTLIAARIANDFTVENVALHSNIALPLLYKIAGSWGNHEGSMLLWLCVLTGSGAWLSIRVIAPEEAMLRMRALAVQGLLTAGSALFVLSTSNPFTRLTFPPLDGEALNPLLQDIGLALHPPLLYTGYVGFSLVFSLACAALIEGKLERGWAIFARPFLLFSWSALTLGIGMGSWWAYRELGWGGFWFWDPVENASLLPWLAGTALIHCNLALEKRGALKHWTILLAILTFGLSMIGTFLVRSGVLTSVHSFASDPARGFFILIFVCVMLGGALLLYALRAPALGSSPRLRFISREGMLVLNNLLMITACLTLLFGTLYPLMAEWLQGTQVTLAAPYFNKTVLPLLAASLPLAGIAPLLSWRQGHIARVKRTLAAAAGITIATLVLLFALWDRAGAAALIGIGIAVWLGATSLSLFARQGIKRIPTLPLRLHAVALAHLGAAILAAGITMAGLYQQELSSSISTGESVTLGGYHFFYGDERFARQPNYITKIASVRVSDVNGNEIATLHPEYRAYRSGSDGGMRYTSEAYISSTPLLDIYAALGESIAPGTSNIRIYINPMMQWIWAGCILITLGGALAIAPHRLRKKREPR